MQSRKILFHNSIPTVLPYLNMLTSLKVANESEAVKSYSYLGNLMSKNIIISGPTASGKSSNILASCRNIDWNPDFKVQNKWFNPEFITGDNIWHICEDISLDFFNEFETNIKQWTDHYPITVEFKGGTGLLNPISRWSFTTNHSLDDIIANLRWAQNEANKKAFIRRFLWVQLYPEDSFVAELDDGTTVDQENQRINTTPAKLPYVIATWLKSYTLLLSPEDFKEQLNEFSSNELRDFGANNSIMIYSCFTITPQQIYNKMVLKNTSGQFSVYDELWPTLVDLWNEDLLPFNKYTDFNLLNTVLSELASDSNYEYRALNLYQLNKCWNQKLISYDTLCQLKRLWPEERIIDLTQEDYSTDVCVSIRFTFSILVEGGTYQKDGRIIAWNGIVPPSKTTFYGVICAVDGYWSNNRNANFCFLAVIDQQTKKIIDFYMDSRHLQMQ